MEEQHDTRWAVRQMADGQVCRSSPTEKMIWKLTNGGFQCRMETDMLWEYADIALPHSRSWSIVEHGDPAFRFECSNPSLQEQRQGHDGQLRCDCCGFVPKEQPGL